MLQKIATKRLFTLISARFQTIYYKRIISPSNRFRMKLKFIKMANPNHKKYMSLLEALIENATALKNSAMFLLGAELNKNNGSNFENIKKQDQAIHAQHFLYLSLEEIGKFFLILKQYPQSLDSLKLKELGFYDHDSKIETLIIFVKKIQLKNNKTSAYPIKGA